MNAIMKTIADLFRWPTSWDVESNELHSYFTAEYKKDAKHAYEYWLATGNTDFV